MSHLTVAIGETGVKELVKGIVKNFVFEKADSKNFGPFTAGYDIKLHLEGGTVDLTNANTVKIEELDVKWDRLKFSLTVDIPKICTPDGCVTIFGEEICIPQFCIFKANPDINVQFDLSTFVTTSEISGELRPLVRYFVHPARPATMNYLVAEETPDPDDPTNPDKNLANQWQLVLDPVWMDIDLIDFEDTVEDLLEALVDGLINTVFAGFPGWAKSAILAITGPLIDFIGDILDIGDDFDEWLSDLFNISFGLGDLILNLLADFLTNRNPIKIFEDPMPIIEDQAESGLIPVKLPIASLSAVINTDELVLEGTIGASL